MDKDLRNVARDHQVPDTKMFDDEDNNDDNRKKKGEEKLKDNINVPTADLYSYIVAITRIYL